MIVLVLAVVAFVLSAFDQSVWKLGPVNLIALGLALLALHLLLPSLPGRLVGRRR